MPANKPYILGLTGGIGCGKSEAAKTLKALGAAHIDADAISRCLTAENGAALPAIHAAFGDQVFHADGTLDRPALSRIVFTFPGRKAVLEGILHPMISAEIDRQFLSAAENGYTIAVLDVPLLFETGMDALCDSVWVMTADRETQIIRVMERGLTREAAEARIANQMSASEREARADIVIRSDRPTEETKAELTELYQNLLTRKEKHGQEE